MSHSVKVQVHWKNSRAENLINGSKYTTVSRFQENWDTWFKEAWSIALDFEIPPSEQGSPSIATAHFLASKGPHQWLKAGTSFDLYEGDLKTATVKVCAD